jgi:hypothetical protein
MKAAELGRAGVFLLVVSLCSGCVSIQAELRGATDPASETRAFHNIVAASTVFGTPRVFWMRAFDRNGAPSPAWDANRVYTLDIGWQDTGEKAHHKVVDPNNMRILYISD